MPADDWVQVVDSSSVEEVDAAFADLLQSVGIDRAAVDGNLIRIDTGRGVGGDWRRYLVTGDLAQRLTAPPGTTVE